MLINSKKFDVRLYVVIKGFDKIEAYICDEGIARLCTVSPTTPSNLSLCVFIGKLQEA